MKWEYRITKLKMPYHSGEIKDIQQENEKRLNELGQKGWDCFHVAGSYYYFKRPIKQLLDIEFSISQGHTE